MIKQIVLLCLVLSACLAEDLVSNSTIANEVVVQSTGQFCNTASDFLSFLPLDIVGIIKGSCESWCNIFTVIFQYIPAEVVCFGLLVLWMATSKIAIVSDVFNIVKYVLLAFVVYYVLMYLNILPRFF